MLLLISYAVLFAFLFFIVKWSLYRSAALRNIPGPRSESWITGNLSQIFNAKGLPYHQDLVDRFGGIVKVHGFFGDEQLYISDPRALQSILVKDQDAFEETSVFIETNKAIFGPGLVATIGEHHKKQRKIINPVFSVNQLRDLVPVCYEVSEKLSAVMTKESTKKMKDGGESILDMSEWMSRVALEMVGQAILGYSFDPLDSTHNNSYTSAIKELIPTLFSLSLLRQFAPFLARLGPPWFRRKLVEWTPVRSIQKVKHMSDVMYETALGILRQKRDLILSENCMDSSVDAEIPSTGAKDIISVLLRANDRVPDDEKLSESELVGQVTVLVFGAQDTTSAALSRILYMLSRNRYVQQRIREELSIAHASTQDDSGRLSYDALMNLPWLDAVIKETLRLYPPVPFIRRSVVKERTIPLSQSLPGAPTSSIAIPLHTTLFVSISGSNRLESVWGEDAKEWKPERWLSSEARKASDKNRARLPSIFAGMLSFLAGERSCIGYKFAQVEMKILLSTLLSRFAFSPTEDEIVWNLSQIISPSVRTISGEIKGLPLHVLPVEGIE